MSTPVILDNYTPTDWLPSTEGGSNPEIRKRIFAMLKELATYMIAQDPVYKRLINEKVDEMHKTLHQAYEVESLNDLDEHQVKHLIAMLKGRIYQLTPDK